MAPLSGDYETIKHNRFNYQPSYFIKDWNIALELGSKGFLYGGERELTDRKSYLSGALRFWK